MTYSIFSCGPRPACLCMGVEYKIVCNTKYNIFMLQFCVIWSLFDGPGYILGYIVGNIPMEIVFYRLGNLDGCAARLDTIYLHQVAVWLVM